MFKGYVLVSDMDGTLIDDNKEISKENIDAINYFIENGGLFTVATGRRRNGYKKYSDMLNINLPAILRNGGVIYDFSNEEKIYDSFLESERKEVAKKLVDSGLDIEISISIDDDTYILKENKYTKRFERDGFKGKLDLPEDIYDKNWGSIVIVGDEDILDSLESEFNSKYDSEIPTRSDFNYLEVVPKSTSKGRALEILIDKYNLYGYKIIAVGDNMNDKEMIEFATYGFAMKNGNKRLVENAKFKAPTNNEHAIAYIVNKLKSELEL